ncbi:MAG: hypothetical protein EPN71_04830 [Rhodanobacter sp.]|nr:MAG: hypothetical protein EPN71_04830 [Rhodanobacter sp.]TAM39373.1 MAG: hypothetical protein EPN58_13610 [Rhodanobacter sp.]
MNEKSKQLDSNASSSGHGRQARWTPASNLLDTDASLDTNTSPITLLPKAAYDPLQPVAELHRRQTFRQHRALDAFAPSCGAEAGDLDPRLSISAQPRLQSVKQQPVPEHDQRQIAYIKWLKMSFGQVEDSSC